MFFADLSIYHSTLDEWPFEKLISTHPQWNDAVQMQQVHGDQITEISETITTINPCDALLSHHKNKILIVKTADCVPIAVTDYQKAAFAAIHAGRAGTQKEILKKTLKKLIKTGSQPSNLWVYLGPSIGPCCYEINRDTKEKYDLWQTNVDQALETDIPLKQIQVSGICTRCHSPKKYYSYRGGDLEKRFFTVISKIQS